MCTQPPVSVIVPVLNEERNLAACLASLRAFSDVFVVDSGSADGTRAVATSFGREVIDFRWSGRFPKKRNWALQRCPVKQEWVLFMDADERATPAFVEELARTLPSTRKKGFLLTYDNWFMGRQLRHGDPMRKVALIRKGFGAYERTEEVGWSRFDAEVHEPIIVTGEVGRIRARLEHHDQRDLHYYFARHNEYSSWEAARWMDLQRRSAVWRLPLRQRIKYTFMPTALMPIIYFLGSYLLKGGFLDGRAGLMFALAKTSYFGQVVLKIRERQRLVAVARDDQQSLGCREEHAVGMSEQVGGLSVVAPGVLPTISIVTAVRNGRDTILDCLATVRAQSRAAEHVVIDGASDDGTREVLREWEQGGLIVESEPDLGIYDAMNKGIDRSSGEVVGILNADDLYARDDVLARIAAVFRDPSVDACHGDLVYVSDRGQLPSDSGRSPRVLAHRQRPDGSRFFLLPNEKTVRYWRGGPASREAFLRGWMPPHPTFFVRRKYFREYGTYRLDMGSAADYELMLRFLVRHRLRSVYLPHVLVKMRCGGASNKSPLARFKANLLDRRAWSVNGLRPSIATPYLKPLRKLPQWLRHVPKEERVDRAGSKGVV